MSALSKLACGFWFLLGLGAAIGGAIASGASMADMSGGFFVFPDTICSANSFYMGVFGGGGVDNPKKLGAFDKAKGPGTFHDTFYTRACLGSSVQLECAQPDVHCCEWNDDADGVVCAPQAETSFTSVSGNVSASFDFVVA